MDPAAFCLPRTGKGSYSALAERPPHSSSASAVAVAVAVAVAGVAWCRLPCGVGAPRHKDTGGLQVCMAGTVKRPESQVSEEGGSERESGSMMMALRQEKKKGKITKQDEPCKAVIVELTKRACVLQWYHRGLRKVAGLLFPAAAASTPQSVSRQSR